MSETNVFWDPLSDNILQERDDTGAVTAEYTTEPGLYGNLISQNRGGFESQYHFDAFGSTLALTDDNQQVTDTYAYSGFGEISEKTGNSLNPFEYVGQKGYFHDETIQQDLVRRRLYVALTGRWITEDRETGGSSWYSSGAWEWNHGDNAMTQPDGNQPLRRGSNLYSYCDNRPLQSSDPSGLAPEDKGPKVCLRQREDAKKDKKGKYTCPKASQTLVFDSYYVREGGKPVLKMRVWCIECGGEPNPCAEDEECARKVFEEKDKKTGLPFQETVCVCCKKAK